MQETLLVVLLSSVFLKKFSVFQSVLILFPLPLELTIWQPAPLAPGSLECLGLSKDYYRRCRGRNLQPRLSGALRGAETKQRLSGRFDLRAETRFITRTLSHLRILSAVFVG